MIPNVHTIHPWNICHDKRFTIIKIIYIAHGRVMKSTFFSVLSSISPIPDRQKQEKGIHCHINCNYLSY